MFFYEKFGAPFYVDGIVNQRFNEKKASAKMLIALEGNSFVVYLLLVIRSIYYASCFVCLSLLTVFQ